MLRLELETLQEMDFDLSLVGFHDDYIDSLLDIEADLPELDDGDRDPFQEKTFTLHDDQCEVVDEAIAKVMKHPDVDSGINENGNGNALALICKLWLKGRK